MTVAVDATVFDVIAEEASRESSLWGESLLPPEEREPLPVFSSLVPEAQLALGVETIYEGYLVHYGRARLFAPADADTALLLGDYLYAHGLVRVSATGNVAAVSDLAELISLCAQRRAEALEHDGVAWTATAALLGERRLDEARRTLRERRDPTALEAAARATAGDDAVERALLLHRGRVL